MRLIGPRPATDPALTFVLFRSKICRGAKTKRKHLDGRLDPIPPQRDRLTQQQRAWRTIGVPKHQRWNYNCLVLRKNGKSAWPPPYIVHLGRCVVPTPGATSIGQVSVAKTQQNRGRAASLTAVLQHAVDCKYGQMYVAFCPGIPQVDLSKQPGRHKLPFHTQYRAHLTSPTESSIYPAVSPPTNRYALDTIPARPNPPKTRYLNGRTAYGRPFSCSFPAVAPYITLLQPYPEQLRPTKPDSVHPIADA